MLVRYIRKNGIPVGCVVATGRDSIGYMVALPNLPTPSKRFMKMVAVGRSCYDLTSEEDIAERILSRVGLFDTPKGSEYSYEQMNIRTMVKSAVEDMRERSHKYYNIEASV